MHVKDLYSIVVTDKRVECRDREFGLAFMAPDHPSKPPGPETFNGKGMFITLQVEDAAAEFARMTRDGLSIVYPLRDEPWGQRRFGLHDPAGTWIDVIEQIDPAPGFWERYLT